MRKIELFISREVGVQLSQRNMTFGVYINVSIDAPELCCPSVVLLVEREDEDEQEDDKDQVFEVD